MDTVCELQARGGCGVPGVHSRDAPRHPLRGLLLVCHPGDNPGANAWLFGVNSHTNASRIGWHVWEINLRFAPGFVHARDAPHHPHSKASSGARFYMQRELNENLSGHYIYCTKCSILLVNNMLCSKPHYQKVLN